MPEVLQLAAPCPTLESWRYSSCVLDWDAAVVIVRFRSNINTEAVATYGPNASPALDARTIMRSLNTQNFATKSMERRWLEKAMADGFLGAGTIIVAP